MPIRRPSYPFLLHKRREGAWLSPRPRAWPGCWHALTACCAPRRRASAPHAWRPPAWRPGVDGVERVGGQGGQQGGEARAKGLKRPIASCRSALPLHPPFPRPPAARDAAPDPAPHPRGVPRFSSHPPPPASAAATPARDPLHPRPPRPGHAARRCRPPRPKPRSRPPVPLGTGSLILSPPLRRTTRPRHSKSGGLHRRRAAQRARHRYGSG